MQQPKRRGTEDDASLTNAGFFEARVSGIPPLVMWGLQRSMNVVAPFIRAGLKVCFPGLGIEQRVVWKAC
jgi:hypothetical protein